jgi:protein translocase SecG subunit
MLNILLILHVACSIFLIFLILLNKGKGSELSVLNQNNELLNSKDSSLMLNRLIILVVILSVLINFLIFKFTPTSYDSSKELVNLSKYQIYYK